MDLVARDATAWDRALGAEIAAHRLANREHGSDPTGQLEVQRQIVAAHLEAARQFEALTGDPAYAVRAHWHGARAIWSSGEALPLEDIDGRVKRFTEANEMVSRGLQIDEDCAECLLWKFIAMGRLHTTLGGLEAARHAAEMARLLDRGIELRPTHSDSPNNSTLGNLHYTSAIFYRVVPDWFWLEWIIGVRGDKERALSHIETALKLHPTRIDFKVELGSQLLCQGATKRGQAERLDRGIEVLEAVILEKPRSLDDAREIEAAKVMLRSPAISCGYTGDRFLEFDEDDAKRG